MAANFQWGLKQAKAAFFDRDAVRNAVDASTRRLLSKVGALVRRQAKQSIRKRKKPSPPGSPPSSHTGVLKDFIFFAYDANKKTVVIGPTRTNQRNAFAIDTRAMRNTIPAVIERGGGVAFHEHLVGHGKYAGQWIRTDLRRRKAGHFRSNVGRPTRIRQATYQARPYMRPAGEAITSKFKELLRNFVR